MIGEAFQVGIGFTQDTMKALEWYESAAEDSFPPAQYLAGRIYVSLQTTGLFFFFF
jgi:TPR repeat protein